MSGRPGESDDGGLHASASGAGNGAVDGPVEGPVDGAGTGVVPSVYLTEEVPPIGGRIKERPEDFIVEELPLYEPCGEGEHAYLFVEKRGMSTLEMIRIIAQHFDVPRQSVGYAGLKDKAAITRQVISVHMPGRRPEDVPMLRHDRISVLWVDLHKNKLRQGHLQGNRFSIRVRGVAPTAALSAKRVLDVLEQRGVPNRIGEQRFGHLANNHRIGLAMILGDHRAALDELLGPGEHNLEAQREARALYAAGDYVGALERFPGSLRAERDALRVLVRGGGPSRAMRAVGRTAAEFYLTAFQSAVFNAILDDRLTAGTLGRLGVGDLAWKHDSRACFAVDEAVIADPATSARLDAIEISPSGPMWGVEMMRAAGEVDRAEVRALEAAGIGVEALSEFERRSRLRLNGTRRPLRVRLTDPDVEGGVDEHGSYVRLAFDLPRGAFATEVLREVMKPEAATVASGAGAGAGEPDTGAEEGVRGAVEGSGDAF